jgi:hypothetical protein
VLPKPFESIRGSGECEDSRMKFFVDGRGPLLVRPASPSCFSLPGGKCPQCDSRENGPSSGLFFPVRAFEPGFPVVPALSFELFLLGAQLGGFDRTDKSFTLGVQLFPWGLLGFGVAVDSWEVTRFPAAEPLDILLRKLDQRRPKVLVDCVAGACGQTSGRDNRTFPSERAPGVRYPGGHPCI